MEEKEKGESTFYIFIFIHIHRISMTEYIYSSGWIEQLPIIFLRQPVSVLESLVFSLP